VLPPKAKLAIELRICGGEHAAVTGREQFAGMKREARYIGMWLANLLPSIVPRNLAAHSAGSILNDGKVMLVGNP
jgi:hypothetical protein